MSNVEFETDYEPIPTRFYSDDNPNGQKPSGDITQWLIKKGYIRDESSAKGVLLGIIILNIILTSLIIYFFIL